MRSGTNLATIDSSENRNCLPLLPLVNSTHLTSMAGRLERISSVPLFPRT